MRFCSQHFFFGRCCYIFFMNTYVNLEINNLQFPFVRFYSYPVDVRLRPFRFHIFQPNMPFFIFFIYLLQSRREFLLLLQLLLNTKALAVVMSMYNATHANLQLPSMNNVFEQICRDCKLISYASVYS